MYKFIKVLSHTNPEISHVAYLYQDMTTHKYYLSYTHFNREYIEYKRTNQYMLLIDNEPKTTKRVLKNINIVKEVTLNDFILKKINDYKL